MFKVFCSLLALYAIIGAYTRRTNALISDSQNVTMKPRTFITTERLKHKRLGSHLQIDTYTSIETTKNCNKKCVQNENCTAFSYNQIGYSCILYNLKTNGNSDITAMGYRLYVLKKWPEDNYMQYDDTLSYYKLVLDAANFFDAEKKCQEENGHLASIKDAKVLKVFEKKILEVMIPRTLIGLNDNDKEGEWVYTNGKAWSYRNWYYRGKWNRNDLNCATLRSDLTFEQESCFARNYYICELPMY